MGRDPVVAAARGVHPFRPSAYTPTQGGTTVRASPDTGEEENETVLKRSGGYVRLVGISKRIVKSHETTFLVSWRQAQPLPLGRVASSVHRTRGWRIGNGRFPSCLECGGSH